jgi:hypothetical protein
VDFCGPRECTGEISLSRNCLFIMLGFVILVTVTFQFALLSVYGFAILNGFETNYF